MAELKKLLGSYLSNICALERCMFETVQLQIQDPQVPAHRKAGPLLSKLVSAHKTHLETLEEKIALSDGLSRMMLAKEAIAAITGTLAGAAEAFRTHRISRMLRDDYTALSYAAMSYTMLHSTALAAGEAEVADLALRHLRHLTPLIVEISQIMPEVVINELADQDSAVDEGVAKAALNNTQRAWNHEATDIDQS